VSGGGAIGGREGPATEEDEEEPGGGTVGGAEGAPKDEGAGRRGGA
jgi:hypothetical protein